MQTVEEDTLETWTSNVKCRIGIARWNRDGIKSIDAVHPGGTLIITSRERARNQSTTARPIDDPFTNGALSLADAPEMDPAERTKFMKNPAALDEDDIEKILNISGKAAFEKKMRSIDSAVVLHRLYAEARSQDIGGDRLKAIRARLSVLEPNGTLPGDHIVVGKEVAPDGAPTVREMDAVPSGPRQYADAP